jgi:transposase-like protein
MSGILIEIYRCDCNPDYTYKTKSTFNSHKKSKRHVNYVRNNQERSHRETIARLQIENDHLKRINASLQEIIVSSRNLSPKSHNPFDLYTSVDLNSNS